MTWVYATPTAARCSPGSGMHLSANVVLGAICTSVVFASPVGLTWGQAAGLVALAVAVVAACGPSRFSRRPLDQRFPEGAPGFGT